MNIVGDNVIRPYVLACCQAKQHNESSSTPFLTAVGSRKSCHVWEDVIMNVYLPSQCWGYFCPKHNDTEIFQKHLSPVMLLFIG